MFDWWSYRNGIVAMGVTLGVVVVQVAVEHIVADARVPIALIGGLIGGYVLGAMLS